MPDFGIKLGGRGANANVLDFMRHYCPWSLEWRFWYRQIVQLSDLTLGPAMTLTVNLNALYPKNVFPTNVDLRAGAKIRRINDWEGGAVSAATMQLGGTFDAGADPNGLLTASNVWTGAGAGYDNTPAAANYARRYESGFVPKLLLTTTTDNNNALVQGEVEVFIPWTPLRSL
jgi:hypothetical protein